jgi:glycine/D-amino acid oxidase-like deaminating enzyme
LSQDLFTADFKETPYWWEASPRPDPDTADLPASAEVLVIGSGYAGLNAALITARGGRDTLVVDAEDAGWGCSTRNGGQISTSIKPGYEELARKHGAEKAFAVLKEGHNALAWIEDFVRAEAIDCSFKVCGRFHAAHSRTQFEALARKVSNQPQGLEVEAEVVPRAEQRRELGSDIYHGGVVYPRHAALDPGRYHQGLLERVLAAGARVAARTPVIGLER